MTNVTQIVATAVQDYSSMEPLAAAVFAVSLGYVALPSFRYQEEVSAFAYKHLTDIDATNPDDCQCKTYYARLVRFASSHASQKHQERLTTSGHDIADTEDTLRGNSLFGARTTDAWPLDIKIVGAISTLSFFVLASGVVHRLFFPNADMASQILWLQSLTVLLIIGMLPPLIFIYSGRRWARTARRHIDYIARKCREEIAANKITSDIPDAAPKMFGDVSEEDFLAIAEKMAPVIKKVMGLDQAKSSASRTRDNSAPTKGRARPSAPTSPQAKPRPRK